MSKKLKVGVLFGGKSPEHEISKISGREVIKNLNKDKYEIIPIYIDKDGNFDSPAKVGSLKKLIDIAFIAMHGPLGEDGTIQGLLEFLGIPYTGSRVLASALGMDKISSLAIFAQEGLKIPKYVVVDNPHVDIKDFKLPVFVKPANHGSSVGVSKVIHKNQLKQAITLALKYSPEVLVQEFIDGVEVTCAILGNDKPKALPLVEIVPKKEFFDYEAKYDANLTDEIVPARISKSLTKKAQEAALKAYRAIGCKDFGRVDMIIRGKDIYALEINTIPGLTPVSLFPKAAKAAGISYEKLLDKIISLSQEN
ncbi:MAG: D-alanine--D-alanine ligase [Candidatus Curtissbacteria bacterium]|nr:D-alanine--D-alanine ligase [Candidatus Curtissbacteria bacterium]